MFVPCCCCSSFSHDTNRFPVTSLRLKISIFHFSAILVPSPRGKLCQITLPIEMIRAELCKKIQLSLYSLTIWTHDGFTRIRRLPIGTNSLFDTVDSAQYAAELTDENGLTPSSFAMKLQFSSLFHYCHYDSHQLTSHHSHLLVHATAKRDGAKQEAHFALEIDFSPAPTWIIDAATLSIRRFITPLSEHTRCNPPNNLRQWTEIQLQHRKIFRIQEALEKHTSDPMD